MPLCTKTSQPNQEKYTNVLYDLGEIRSQSRNIIKQYNQILSTKPDQRNRAFSPFPEIDEKLIMSGNSRDRIDKVKQQNDESRDELPFMSKLNLTSTGYFANLYKHRIPLKSYYPVSETRNKLVCQSSKNTQRNKNHSFQRIYDGPSVRSSRGHSKVAEYLKNNEKYSSFHK